MLQRLRAMPAPSRDDAPKDALTWARENATIVHPALGRIPFAPYPYQAEFLKHAHEPRRIVLKARQIGYSQIFALEALYTAITQREATVLLVSRSQDLAVNLLRYCYQTYNGLKDPPALEKQNESEMGLANGSRIKSIPANRSTGRGFAATSIYLDEFAYASYADDIYQSVSPAVSQGGRIVIGSTPNGIGNLFHRLYVAGAGFWKQRITWDDCPSYYTDEERERGMLPHESAWYLRERPKYTESQWASEYDCSFERSGGGVFRRVSECVGAERQDAPVDGHRYVMGVDWARTHDYTVITVLDVTTKSIAAIDRFSNVDYKTQTNRLKIMSEKFKPVQIVSEGNSMGGPLTEDLQSQGLPVVRFDTTAQSKAALIQGLEIAFERGDIRIIDDEDLINELNSYEQERLATGIRYGAPAGMHDDMVMSLALAWHAGQHIRETGGIWL